MFFFLFSLVASTFITFDGKDMGAIDVFNNESIHQVIELGGDFALLVVDDDYSQESYIARNIFASAASAFVESILFGLINAKHIPEYLENCELKAPFILCFRGGEVITGFEAALDDNYCIFQIKSIFLEPKEFVPSLDELNSYVTNLDYTIIARGKSYYDAHNMMLNVLPDLETCGIICAKDSVFKEMGMADASFALFRRDDTVIVPFENSTESLLYASKTYYSYFDDDDFTTKDTIFAAVIQPEELKEDDEFHENMLKVAEKFPNFRFGICDDTTTPYTERVIDHKFGEFPDFAVFNYEVGFFYPTSQFAGIDINSTWADMVIDLLTGIENGTVKKMFLSEEIPETQEDPLYTKLVGKTYKEFINSTDKDAIIMYIEGESSKGKSEIFQKVAHELNESGIDSIRFAHINILSNSDDAIPELVQMPHVEYYKHGANDSVPMFSHLDEQGLKRFIKKNSGLNIEVEEITPEAGWEEVDIIENAKIRFSDRIVKYADRHIEELKAILPPRPEPAPEENETETEQQPENENDKEL